jgi:ribosomal protein S6--L-glutamate ligase
MILSYHPCFEGDKNILCAGREPDESDLAAIKAARAVILPQGCRQSLYEMARGHCKNVFPNYDVRFNYPGKIEQICLFQETQAPHPKTRTYLTVQDFFSSTSDLQPAICNLPLVFKFDWGGEGDNVFLIRDAQAFQEILQRAAAFEKSGQKGFLIQEYIPHQNRTLRVVIIGAQIISYWRVQKSPENFCANLAKGAVIDTDTDPDLQTNAAASLKNFCKKTGINLAGFDFLFSSDPRSEFEINTPLFLEINYFFGRSGLGGSERFYELLNAEITRWIQNL